MVKATYGGKREGGGVKLSEKQEKIVELTHLNLSIIDP